MNAAPRQQDQQRAFTLTELLVVLCVVAVLAGVTYSAGSVFIERGRIIQSTTNLRSLAIANTTYLAEYGVYCPASDMSTNRRWHGKRTSGKGAYDATKGFLSPYFGAGNRVIMCPLFKSMVGSISFESGTGGYGYNSQYIGGLPDGSFDPRTLIMRSERSSNVPDPGRTVMFTTTAYARASGLQEYPFCEPPFWPSGGRPSPTVHFRADGKALVAWCDGSVTSESRNDSKGGENPHGGNAEDYDLGWFGPTKNNGYWNPAFKASAKHE